MMIRRVCALLMALALLCASAAAEDTIAAYSLPQGAEVCFITEADRFSVPGGLEPMYELMQHASPYSDVYLVRMKNGRALASVSCTPVKTPRTAQQLLELWPQIAQNLSAEAVLVNEDPSCASVKTLYGREMLHIRTQLAAGTQTVVPLQAEGFAFCRGSQMIEVWMVCPEEAVYYMDEAAAAELESDLADLLDFADSLDFSVSEAAGGMHYADPDGRFFLMLPVDTVVLTAASTPEAVAQARAAYVAANPAGAGAMFDEYMKDVTEMNAHLFLTADMKGAMQIFCEKAPNFKGATTAMLCRLAPSIAESLQERFGVALLLGVDDGSFTLSGHPQATLNYWLRTEECNAQLDVAACVIGEDWLCEVDVYSIDGDQTTRETLLSLAAQTLVYTVE